MLLDHPAVVGVLNEILSHQQLAGPEAYGFRFDHTFCSQLREGEHNFDRAHGGGGLWSFRGNSHIYQMQPGRVHSGLTRVAWELEPIAYGEGTHFASGSHKSAIARPAEVSGEGQSGRLFDSYECPAGSCVIFTESVCHKGVPAGPSGRLTLFTCYDTVASVWAHPDRVPPACVIEAMPPLRQSLFRQVWHGMGDGDTINRYWSPANSRALL